MRVNLIDGIILLLLAAGAWQGYRRGLICTAGGLIGFFAGVWLAGRYYLPFARFLGERLGLEKLLTAIFIPLCAGIPAGGAGILPFMTGMGPGAVDPSGFPPPLWEPVIALQSGLSAATRAHLLAGAVTKLIAFFIIWGCVTYLTGLAAAVLTRVAHLFFLGGLNRLGGVGLGLVERTLAVTVAVGMLTPLVFSFALNASGSGVAAGIAKAWRTSLLIPYFTKGWNAAAPVLQQFFHMI